MRNLIFTLDLEDHRPNENTPIRFEQITDDLLGCLEEWNVRGTFFVVGATAELAPELVRRVADQNHEIALHGADHTPLPDVGPTRFRSETETARKRLSDLAGAEVVGFRAPTFSLVPDSDWAPAILSELGFMYSSSVLPARSPLYGWPGAPRRTFRWPAGLIEFPCPVFGLGPVSIPLLGGTYLRIAPWPLVRLAARSKGQDPEAWLYSHPYDFDPGEPKWIVPDVGRVGTPLLWFNRKNMHKRVKNLVEGSSTKMADVATRLAAGTDVPVWTPNSNSEGSTHE